MELRARAGLTILTLGSLLTLISLGCFFLPATDVCLGLEAHLSNSHMALLGLAMVAAFCVLPCFTLTPEECSNLVPYFKETMERDILGKAVREVANKRQEERSKKQEPKD